MSQVLSIAIAGAGIGGLTAAAFLARAGHRVVVFDQFTAPRPVGSGLVIQPVGQAVLGMIGAEAAFARGAWIHRMTGIEVVGGRKVLDVRYDHKGGPRRGLAIHRSALFEAVHAAALAAGAVIVPSTRIDGTRACRDGREVMAKGATLGRFDLLVDAAGAGSALSPLKARALGYGAIWGTVPWPVGAGVPQDELTQRYRRADRMAGVMPLGQVFAGQPAMAAVFWSLPRADLDGWAAADIDGWKAEVTDLWPQMAPFVAQIGQNAEMTPARYSHGTLRKPYGDRLVHIGDAAHRASPQLGQGANMALLDAYALALAVQTEGADPGPLYAKLRRWHVRLYQGMSAVFTPQYQSGSRILPIVRDRLLMPVSQIWPVPRILTRLVGGDLILPLAGVDFPPRPRHAMHQP